MFQVPDNEQVAVLAIWLLGAVLLGYLLWRRNSVLGKLFFVAAAARIVVAVLQSGYDLFIANGDSLVYALKGSQIASDPSVYILGDVVPNQRGIIATSAWVATFHGPIPITVMVAILASLISALAVVVVMAPFLGGADGSPDYFRYRRLLFYAAAFSPSFLFWGSQGLKEPFLMLGLALFVHSFYVGWPMKAVLGPTGILLCLSYRPYIGALVAGVGVLFALARPARRIVPRATLALLFAAALFVGAKFGPSIVGVDLKEQAFNSEQAGGNSVVETIAGAGWLSNAGKFFFAPLPWQTPRNAQGLLSYIESMIIGILIIRYLLQIVARRREIAGDGALIAVLLYCTAASIYAAGLANTGTLSRERSPFLLVLLPLLISPPERAIHLGRPKGDRPKNAGTPICLDPKVPSRRPPTNV